MLRLKGLSFAGFRCIKGYEFLSWGTWKGSVILNRATAWTEQIILFWGSGAKIFCAHVWYSPVISFISLIPRIYKGGRLQFSSAYAWYTFSFKIVMLWRPFFARVKVNHTSIYSSILARACAVAMTTGLVKRRLKKWFLFI